MEHDSRTINKLVFNCNHTKITKSPHSTQPLNPLSGTELQWVYRLCCVGAVTIWVVRGWWPVYSLQGVMPKKYLHKNGSMLDPLTAWALYNTIQYNTKYKFIVRFLTVRLTAQHKFRCWEKDSSSHPLPSSTALAPKAASFATRL